MLAVAFALIAFSGVRVAGGAIAIFDPFLILSVVAALLSGVSFTASAAQRRLIVVGYFFVVAAAASALTGAPLGEHLGNATRFLLAAIGMPWAVMTIAQTFSEIRLLAVAFVVSACTTVIVGISDAALGTEIGRTLAPQIAVSEIRFSGLSSHANHLGIVCAMSLPLAIAMGLATRERLLRALPSVAAIAVLLLGVGISGSRAALGGTAAGLICFGVLQRKRLPELGGLVGVALCVVLLLFVGGSLALENFRTPLDRLLDPTSTAVSDAGHAAAQASATSAFLASPLWGTGFQEIRGGLSVPLQIGASAGVIGIAAFLAFIATTLDAGIRVLRGRPLDPVGTRTGEAQALAAGCLAGGAAWLVAGLAQNAIFDRFIYVPFGLTLALGALATRPHRFAATRTPGIARGGRKQPIPSQQSKAHVRKRSPYSLIRAPTRIVSRTGLTRRDHEPN